MAYPKPALFMRSVFNRLAMRFGIGGSVTLAVAGRRSGREQTIAVIPMTVAGARYLVSPRGEADRVDNLQAAGGAEVRDKPSTRRSSPPGLSAGGGASGERELRGPARPGGSPGLSDPARVAVG